jgi:hypothetical protein
MDASGAGLRQTDRQTDTDGLPFGVHFSWGRGRKDIAPTRALLFLPLHACDEDALDQFEFLSLLGLYLSINARRR